MGWFLRMNGFHITKLTRIHKCGFHPVEDYRSNDNHHKHNAETKCQVRQVHRPRAQEGIAENLHTGRHRVCQDDPA